FLCPACERQNHRSNRYQLRYDTGRGKVRALRITSGTCVQWRSCSNLSSLLSEFDRAEVCKDNEGSLGSCPYCNENKLELLSVRGNQLWNAPCQGVSSNDEWQLEWSLQERRRPHLQRCR